MQARRVQSQHRPFPQQVRAAGSSTVAHIMGLVCWVHRKALANHCLLSAPQSATARAVRLVFWLHRTPLTAQSPCPAHHIQLQPGLHAWCARHNNKHSPLNARPAHHDAVVCAPAGRRHHQLHPSSLSYLQYNIGRTALAVQDWHYCMDSTTWAVQTEQCNTAVRHGQYKKSSAM